MPTKTTALGLLLLLAASCAEPRPPEHREHRDTTPASSFVPQYTAAGELVRPPRYDDWVFLGSSLGLSYSDGEKRDGPGVFHNVFLEPSAFRHYASSGVFPEKTMLILALHEPRQRESINKQGFFQGDLVALEVALKDHERFPEGWAYFDFGKKGQAATAAAFPRQTCHHCHAEHAADDNVFVQFYPVLRRLREARTAVSPIATRLTPARPSVINHLGTSTCENT